MFSSRARVLFDVAGAASVAYLSVWLYEFANWVSLSLVGVNATLVMVGVLPGGVLGVSTGSSVLALAKPVQVFLTLGVAGLCLAALRGRQLPATKFVLFCTASVSLASIYWELLSLLSFIPVAVHEGAFLGLSFCTLGALLLMRTRFQRGSLSSPSRAQ
jgi:hypothetical protein